MNPYSWIWQYVLFCNEFARAALYYVWLPLLLTHRFHISIGWVGFCTSCQFAADASTKVLYGIAASRGHSKWMLRSGAAVSCVSVGGLLFIHNSNLILLFSLLFGCGAASVWPAALSHFSRLDADAQGESMAKAFTPWIAGTGVGMFLPNILLHHRASIYLTLSLSAIVVFLGALFLRPEDHKRTPSLRRESQLILILFRKIKVFLPPMVIQTMVIGTITPFLALFAIQSLHLYPSQYAILLIGIGTITVLLLIPFGKISDRIGRLPLLTIAFLISSLSILSLAECHTWGKALIVSAFFGASFGAVFPAWNALFLNSVPSWLHSRAIGLFTAIEDSGTILGPFIGALSWQYLGPPGPFLLAGTLMLILTLYFLIWWRVSARFKSKNYI